MCNQLQREAIVSYNAKQEGRKSSDSFSIYSSQDIGSDEEIELNVQFNMIPVCGINMLDVDSEEEKSSSSISDSEGFDIEEKNKELNRMESKVTQKSAWRISKNPTNLISKEFNNIMKQKT